MRSRLLALGVLAAVLTLAGVVHADDAARLEKAAGKQEARIADTWLDLAGWLADRDCKAEARDALERGRALDSDAKVLEKLEARIDALAGEGTPDEAAKKRIRRSREKAAKGYDRLSKVFDKTRTDPRFSGSLLEALALAPSKKRLQTVATLAKKAPLLMGSPVHPLVGYVSLPKVWKPGKAWPVLVCVDGAGANHLGACRAFSSARGSRPWIVVAPHALSCTNEVKPERFPAYSKELVETWDHDRPAFDVPGLLALLDQLHGVFGANEKVVITGFSGGGNLCYAFLLRHPDRVRGAAPACANFNPSLKRGAVEAEEGGPPVHIMTGEKDPHRYLTHGKTPPGIEEQTDWAEAALKENGFRHVTRTMLPGVGHSALRKEVWAFADDLPD